MPNAQAPLYMVYVKHLPFRRTAEMRVPTGLKLVREFVTEGEADELMKLVAERIDVSGEDLFSLILIFLSFLVGSCLIRSCV